MSLIIEKTYNLLDVLEDSELIKKLTVAKETLQKDEVIISLVKKINQEQDTNKKVILKKELYNNQKYKDYIDAYNELSYIVLKINQQFKKYTDTRGCIQ